MPYYLTTKHSFFSLYEPNDQIQIQLIRNGRTIQTELINDVVKLEHYKTSASVDYIRELVHELDDYTNAHPNGVHLVRRAAEENCIEEEENPSLANRGLFNTFLNYIPRMINFREKEPINFFCKRFSYIFKGVGSILTAITMKIAEGTKLVSSETPASVNAEDKFVAELNQLAVTEEIIVPVKKCVCKDQSFIDPFVLENASRCIQSTQIQACDGRSSVYHCDGAFLGTIIQFGCTGDGSERRMFVYYHQSPNSQRIENVTILFEPKLGSTFKKYSFGMVAITLYKSILKLSKPMIPLVHSFPHIDFHLFSGFRNALLDIIQLKHDHQRSAELSMSVGNFLSTWMIENQLYKGGGESINYYMQPYFFSLSQQNLFHDQKKEMTRLEVLDCPEILMFNSNINEIICDCVHRLTHRYNAGEPVLCVEHDGKLQTGCGKFVKPTELFHHPCYMPNLCIGKDMNVSFPDCNGDPAAYKFLPMYKGRKATSNFIKQHKFCRLCKREYPNLQFSLLCGIRCSLLEQLFITNPIPTRVNSASSAVRAVTDRIREELDDPNRKDMHTLFTVPYVNIVSAVLPAEIPYYKQVAFRKNNSRDCEQIFKIAGNF